MSLVWIIPALGVSVLTVLVVFELLDAGHDKPSRSFIAPAVGMLLLTEGALVLSRGFSGDVGMTNVANGIALIVAGAGVWSLAHRALWNRISTRKH